MIDPKTLRLALAQVDECKRYHPDHCKYHGCLFARALIERDTPVKVALPNYPHVNKAQCQCDGWANYLDAYCSNCGHPLDWSETV